ncbi:MAG: prevent-host-death protein [Acidobacteria bacterium]|nr:MAG: prevent-host-death protein [Acidobacteriota bacterium]
MNVGVRQLRDNLRACLAAVKGGEEVLVTEHGRPVARIVPIAGPANIERLIEAGVISPPTESAAGPGRAKRVGARGPVSELVKDQRR